jgi:hypothetical protein
LTRSPVKEHLSLHIKPEQVTDWLAKSRADHPNQALEYEGLFLDEFVLPKISAYLRANGLTETEACKAFLAESTKARLDKIACDTPASQNKHLFGKEFGTVASTIQSWWPVEKPKKKPKPAVSQSCPDFALRTPCPGIVFEAKLFRAGGSEAAKRALVTGIYQCFFYRALPKIVTSMENRAWDYVYACLLIYDASKQASVVATAWKNALDVVRESCWQTANIYVMILPNAAPSQGCCLQERKRTPHHAADKTGRFPYEPSAHLYIKIDASILFPMRYSGPKATVSVTVWTS